MRGSETQQKTISWFVSNFPLTVQGTLQTAHISFVIQHSYVDGPTRFSEQRFAATCCSRVGGPSYFTACAA